MHFQFDFTPDSPDDETFRSVASLYETGALREVISQAESTLCGDPKHTNLCILKLLAHHAMQEYTAVAKTAQLLADHRGDDSTTALLLGLAAFCNKRFDEAYYHLTKSAQADDSNPFPWLYLARTAFETGAIEQAITLYNFTLKLASHNYAARSELSFCLQILGRHLEAIEHLDFLIQRHSSPELAMRKLKSVQYLCDFRLYGQVVSALTFDSEHPMHPITSMALNVSAQQLRDNAIAFAKRNCSAENTPLDRSCARRPKIRLGYFSNDFHTHATMVLIGDMFSLHNREQFEVIGFDYTTAHDSVTQQTRAEFDELYAIHTLNDRSVAELARQKKIDIAIDLKGWTLNARPNIFQHRAAPLQIAYLGFPGTSGMQEIDYIVADQTLIPSEHQHYYTERILYMPECYQINARSPTPLIDGEAIRSAYGLPRDAFVFCSFNNSFKITPELFEAWMRILEATPEGVLWLLLDDEHAKQNVRLEASRLGINPTRIFFAHTTSYAEHLSRLAAADLFLDSWFYNAHTTASDALWAGLPLVTLCGQTFASRVAASILKAANLSELVTHTPEEYINKAVELARSPANYTSLRSKTETQRTSAPLFDAQRWVRNFEQLLLEAVEHYNRGSTPAAIALSHMIDS